MELVTNEYYNGELYTLQKRIVLYIKIGCETGFAIKQEESGEELISDTYDEKKTTDSLESNIQTNTASGIVSTGSDKIRDSNKNMQCTKVLSTKQSLMHHSRIHTEQKNLCYICGDQFTYPYEVERHIDSFHLGVRYNCDLCEKLFKTKNGLKVHKNEHTGEFKFNCPYCARGNNKTEFEGHIAAHERVKRHSCEKCGKCFVIKSNQKRHTIACGIISKEFACNSCGKLFKEKRYLSDHVKKIHENKTIFQCSTCGEIFIHKST